MPTGHAVGAAATQKIRPSSRKPRPLSPLEERLISSGDFGSGTGRRMDFFPGFPRRKCRSNRLRLKMNWVDPLRLSWKQAEFPQSLDRSLYRDLVNHLPTSPASRLQVLGPIIDVENRVAAAASHLLCNGINLIMRLHDSLLK